MATNSVTTAVILRAVAFFAALQGLAHGWLFVTATPRHGAAELAVIEAMKTNRFFAGDLGYWDFYFGYGVLAAAACLVEAALFWQLARVAQAQPLLVRPMVMLFAAANVCHAVLLTRYFKFPVPIAFDLVIAGTLLVAALVAANAVPSVSASVRRP